MKTLLSSRGLFLLGFLVLIATNIIVLVGVASNRSNEPESQITLTERELALSYHTYEENSGLRLRLDWRALGKEDSYGYTDWRSPMWLNSQKLKALGFMLEDDVDAYGYSNRYKRSIPKEVFIVLEVGGEPYREAVKRAEAVFEREKRLFEGNPEDKPMKDNFERAKRNLEHERLEKTRLFAIDAGLNTQVLREKYADRARYIITRGLVKPGYRYNNKIKEIYGYISKLSVEMIHVPLEHRQMFDSILDNYGFRKNNSNSHQYEVQLAYGQRLEPWIVSVKSRSDKADEK